MAKRNGKEDAINNEEQGSSGQPNPASESKDAGQTGDSGNPGEQKKAHKSYVVNALRFATAYPVGAPAHDDSILPNYNRDSRVPGINVIDYIPTFGVSTDRGSALNRAAYDVMNAIRSQISGNRPYEPADLIIQQTCVRSLRDLFRYVERIYKICSSYSALNLYKPRMILEAMGLDADDWIANVADVYNFLMMRVGSLRPFPTAKIGTIADRQTLYNMAIFKDGEVDQAQMYILNQKAFWSYSMVDAAKGLSLELFPRTFAEFTRMWDRMYSALQNSSDVYIISADIRRAYGENVLEDLDLCAPGTQVAFIEQDLVKCSIMNATIFPRDTNEYLTDLDFFEQFAIRDTQTAGLACTPALRYQNPAAGVEITKWPAKYGHLNSVAADPSDSVRIESVRLRPTFTWTAREDNIFEATIHSMGTEVCIGARVCRIGDTAPYELITQELGSTIFVASSTGEFTGGLEDTAVRYTSFYDIMDSISMLSNFDWHMPITIATMTEDGYYEVVTVIEDIQNYIPISDVQLKTIHEALLLEEFGFPE